jgi:hypothetical protein
MFVAFLLHDEQNKSAIAAGIRRGFIKVTMPGGNSRETLKYRPRLSRRMPDISDKVKPNPTNKFKRPALMTLVTIYAVGVFLNNWP